MNDEKWINEEMRASQNKAEFLTLFNELKKIDPKVILEIGCHQGYSLQAFRVLFPQARVIGIENHPDDIDLEATKDCLLVLEDSHSLAAFHDVTMYLENVGGKVDFLFIDGDHTFESVKTDYEMYAPLVREGGIIAFHDVALKDNPLVDVHKFWELVKKENSIVTVGFGGEGDQLQQTGTGTGILFV